MWGENNTLKKDLLNINKSGLAVSQYQPLQMANDAKINELFPSKGQIQSYIRKDKTKASSKEKTNVLTEQPYIETSEKFKVASRVPQAMLVQW